MEYCVYYIENLVNGKMYIGFTKDFKERKSRHLKDSKKDEKPLYRAIRKYGKANFVFNIFKYVDNLERALCEEIYWIEYLKQQDIILYNLTNGGEGTNGAIFSKETRAKMSKRMSGKGNPMYGVQLFGEANGNFGKKMKPHVKATLRKYRCKLNESQVGQIRKLYETGNYTQTALAQQFNISLNVIHRIVHNQLWCDNPNKNIKTKKNLKKENVIELRKLYSEGMCQKDLAIKYNISVKHVNKIVSRKKWKNI